MTVRRKYKSRHLTLRVEESLATELARVAAMNERPVSDEARIALRNHLREFGPPALEPGDSPFPEAA